MKARKRKGKEERPTRGGDKAQEHRDQEGEGRGTEAWGGASSAPVQALSPALGRNGAAEVRK